MYQATYSLKIQGTRTKSTSKAGYQTAEIGGFFDAGFLEPPVNSHTSKESDSSFYGKNLSKSKKHKSCQVTEENTGTSGTDGKLFPFVEKTSLRQLVASAVIANCPDDL